MLVSLVVAALVVVLVAGVASTRRDANDEQVVTDRPSPTDPAPVPATADTTMPTSDSPSGESTWTGPGFSELPPSGIAVAEDGDLTLFDDAGTELAVATTPAVQALLSSRERLLAAIRPGELVDPIPADLAQVPDGCTRASTAGGVRVALCGGEDQQPQRVELISASGEHRLLAGAPVDSRGYGHWRSAAPSPNGLWVLASWSGECETSRAFILPSSADSVPRTVDDRPTLEGAVESDGVGWALDGRAIVQFGTGLCGAAIDEPGVHLVEPASLERSLVISQPEPGPGVYQWRLEADANEVERVFFGAADELGLERCCGEPSHGRGDLTAGANWQGFDIPVGAAPAGDPPAVPFGDLVVSSEPIEIAGAPAVAGDADLGPFVAYTCGSHVWTFGGAGMGERATPDAVRSLAATLLPHLGCTVSGRPLA